MGASLEEIALVIRSEFEAAGFDQARAANKTLALETQQTAEITAVNVSKSVERLPATMTRATRGFGALSFAMTQGTGTVRELALASGHLITEFGAMSTSASIAAGAAGLGALVAVGTIAVAVLMQTEKAAKASDLAISHIGKLSLNQIDEQIEQQRVKIAVAEASYVALVDKMGLRGSVGPWSPQGRARKDMDEQNAQLTLMIARRDELHDHQRLHVEDMLHAEDLQIKNARGSLELETLKTIQLQHQSVWYAAGTMDATKDREMAADDFTIRRRQIAVESEARATAIKEQFRQLDNLGKEIGLTDKQKVAKAELLENNKKLTREQELQLFYAESIASETARLARASERADIAQNVFGAFDARMAQIQMEKQAEIDKTGNIVAANENAELKIRRLRRDTYLQTVDDLGALAQATADSQNGIIKAIHSGADTLRRIMIGARAAEAAVEAAIEGGRAIASLAGGDLRGFALHTAAALHLAAAAALGARESLGGGGSVGAGGAGGAVGPAMSTTDPSKAAGNVTVVIQTVNPFSREVLGETIYQLNRGGVLKQPIYAPPTAGAYAA